MNFGCNAFFRNFAVLDAKSVWNFKRLSMSEMPQASLHMNEQITTIIEENENFT